MYWQWYYMYSNGIFRSVRILTEFYGVLILMLILSDPCSDLDLQLYYRAHDRASRGYYSIYSYILVALRLVKIIEPYLQLWNRGAWQMRNF